MLQEILKILFPSPCLSCGYLSEALCNNCFHKIEFSPHRRDLANLSVASSMYYQPGSILEKLIHPFKYKHQADIFRIFVPYMTRTLSLLTFEPQKVLLVPVPLFKKRENERGYNQSALLSKWIARMSGAGEFHCLQRIRDTGVQAHLHSRMDRIKNIQGAFKVSRAIPKDSHIVLVDDIVTTGSTLLACNAVLKAAGATNISALTLADCEKTPQNPRD